MLYDKLHPIEQKIFDILAVFLVVFYSYSAVVQPAATQYHRGIYIIITYILVFLTYKSKTKWMRIVDYLLILLSIITIGYWMYNFEAINYRVGAETPLDMGIAIVGVLIGIELARRAVGFVFVIIGVLMLLYGVYGPYMPDLVSHAGETFPGVCTSIFYKSDGVFGIMANVLATYVILFVLFGAFLKECGAQKFFIDFPLAAVGHKIGGPGKVAVVASGLFGSISGSAIANTVSTGAFTIPMMKKAGFRPHVAGGIEPAASIAGMFMPPIMGAGGFIMAELTGVPYSKIMLVAMFPAIMYVFSVFMMVHFEAKIHNIKGEKSEHSPWQILRNEWYYIFPLVLITILMLTGYSPGFSAILGIVSCLFISWIHKDLRMDLTMALLISAVFIGNLFEIPEKFSVIPGILISLFIYFRFRNDTKSNFIRFVEAARSGTESSLKIGAVVGVIGIIIGVLTFSGLVLTFADIVIELANGKLWLTILLIALASLVLGMGVPVTAAYLITAVVAVPALTHLGVNQIAAHMIVYWLSQDSNITPPVCIAAFAGAAIAKANMWKTAFTAFKFAKFLYLGPFLFGYVPAFSLDGSGMDIVKAFIVIIIGTYAYSWFLSGIWYYKLRGNYPVKPAT
jgi:TRAP transporter 4TM/12TM fusion protein